MALDLAQTLKLALTRTESDLDRASELFLRWCEQNSEVADLLKPIVKEAIESRLASLVETPTPQ